MVLGEELALDAVQYSVRLDRVHLGGHDHVRGGEPTSGAVVVHPELMHIEHTGAREHAVANVLHELRGGCLAQERAHGIPHEADTAYQHEQAEREAHPAVELHARALRDQRTGQHAEGGDGVVSGVHRHGFERLGVDAARHELIESHHPGLHPDGHEHDRQQRQAELHGLGMQDAGEARPAELHAHGHDQHRGHEPRQILEAPVTVRMPRVRRALGELEPEQAHDVAGGIRQVVDSVGHDGDRTRCHADRALRQAEQYVADDAHRAGKLPVGAPDHRVRRFAVIMHEQLDEPCGHRTSPLERIHLLNVVQLRL